MGISVTGVKPGNTTVTINSKTSPNISKKVPVTVKSRNLLAYGPASANALTVTVAQDGSLDFDSGTESVPLYKGVRWELDVPEGIVGVPLILSYTGDVPGTLVIGLYANGNSLGGVYQGKNNTAVTIPKGTTRVELRILRGGVTAGSVSGNLKIQLELGNTAHDWMRPDNTSLRGGGSELTNLWPEHQARTSFGITLTPLGNGEYKLAGTCSQSFNIETTRELEAGTYLAPQCQIDSYATYVEIQDSTGETLWRGYQGDTEIAIPKARTYKFRIRFSSGKTVDATFTPRLYKLD